MCGHCALSFHCKLVIYLGWAHVPVYDSISFLTLVDRRGESEESGDDETKRKSLNGEVDSLQAPSTGETTLTISFVFH